MQHPPLGAVAGIDDLCAQPGAAMIAVYLDDPDEVPESQLHAEAGVIVPEHVAIPRGLEEHHVAAGYEIYRNDPRRTPKEQLRTDLYMPIG